MMKTKRFATVALIATTLVALSGCCDGVCDAYDDLKADIANNYEVCCQTTTGDDWSSCIQDAYARHTQLRDTLLAAETACRNDDNDLMREILEDFYNILRPRLVEAIGPTGLNRGSPIANTFIIFKPSDQVDLILPTAPSTTTLLSMQTMRVNEIRYPLSSAGIAIEAETKLSTDGTPPLTVNEPQDTYIADIYQFDQSGAVHVLAGSYDRTLTVSKGSLTVVDLSDAQGARLVPTAMKLVLSGDGISATLALDPTCPYNELSLNANGHGWLGVGVDLTSNSQALHRLDMLGTFWMHLPVRQLSNNSLIFDTDGWAVGTSVFPLQPATIAIATGQSHALNDLPDGQAEVCVDTNGNSTRDGADAIINNYDQYTDCD